MTPELLILTRDAIAALLEENGEIDGLVIERVFARHRLDVLKVGDVGKPVIDDEEAGRIYLRGAQAVADGAKEFSAVMRRGLDEPAEAVTLDDLDQVIEGLSEGD